MNLIWRFFWVILFSRFSPAVNFLDNCSTSFRVLPTDCDVLLHMNNGRYFSFLDIARIDFMIRNNSFKLVRKEKMYGVVASEIIRFKRSINIFKRFEIVTRIVSWDANFFYIVHYFKTENELCALAGVKICFLHAKKGRIKTKEILDIIGITHTPNAMPEWLEMWQDTDQLLYREGRNSL